MDSKSNEKDKAVQPVKKKTRLSAGQLAQLPSILRDGRAFRKLHAEDKKVLFGKAEAMLVESELVKAIAETRLRQMFSYPEDYIPVNVPLTFKMYCFILGEAMHETLAECENDLSIRATNYQKLKDEYEHEQQERATAHQPETTGA